MSTKSSSPFVWSHSRWMKRPFGRRTKETLRRSELVRAKLRGVVIKLKRMDPTARSGPQRSCRACS